MVQTGQENHSELVSNAAGRVNDENSQHPGSFSTPDLTETILIPLLHLDPTPTITPSPTATPIPQPNWLAYLNRFRTTTGLLSLVENEVWSDEDWLHSRYMVKNDYVGHSEDSGNPWYTPDGDAAAQNGNVFVTSQMNAAEEYPISFWMTAPFHAISMIDPQLQAAGFGIYSEDTGYWRTGSTLDVRRGIGPLPPGTSYPIAYPADGESTWLTAYYGGEFPDPLTSCPGYSPPTGPPLMLQLGSGDITPQVIGHSLMADGIPQESCLYDETSYFNSNSSMQWTGRIVLNNRDAIVIMPRYPLVEGTIYSVSITTSNSTVTWSFSVDTSFYDGRDLDSSTFQIGPSAPPGE